MAKSDKPNSTEEAYKAQENTRSDDDVSFGMKMFLSGLKLKFSDVADMSTLSLALMLEISPDKVVLLKYFVQDCRDDAEYAVSHLPGSVQVDVETADVKSLPDRVPGLSDGDGLTEKTIVCYCSMGYRSSVMARKLTAFYEQQPKKGPKGIYNLEGSIFKWANESRPMVNSTGQPTIFAHPYNKVWGKLLKKDLRKEEP